jgi:hypothetical protein
MLEHYRSPIIVRSLVAELPVVAVVADMVLAAVVVAQLG